MAAKPFRLEVLLVWLPAAGRVQPGSSCHRAASLATFPGEAPPIRLLFPHYKSGSVVYGVNGAPPKARLPGFSSQASTTDRRKVAKLVNVKVPFPHLQGLFPRSGFGTYKSKRWFCLSLGCVNSRVSQRTSAGSSPRR